MKTEQWKPIKDTTDRYEVSDRGRVRSYLKQAQGRFVKTDKPQQIANLYNLNRRNVSKIIQRTRWANI